MFATDEYEIEESKKKLFLVPLAPGNKSLNVKDKVYVSVNNVKGGKLQIGKSASNALGMNHSWIKFSYDSGNNVIAWKVRKELDKGQMEENGWKYVEQNKDNGMMVLGIGRMVDTFQHIEKKTYKKLEVKKYQDKQSIIDGDAYFFIEVKDNDV